MVNLRIVPRVRLIFVSFDKPAQRLGFPDLCVICGSRLSVVNKMSLLGRMKDKESTSRGLGSCPEWGTQPGEEPCIWQKDLKGSVEKTNIEPECSFGGMFHCLITCALDEI